MTITTRKEIERYRDMIGFGHHKTKNKKLNEILSGYKKNLPYLVPKKERYIEISKVIRNSNKPVNCKVIANSLNLKEGYVNELVNDMTDKNFLSVDKSNKTFIYSLKEIKWKNFLLFSKVGEKE